MVLLFFFAGVDEYFLGGRERAGVRGSDRFVQDFRTPSRSFRCGCVVPVVFLRVAEDEALSRPRLRSWLRQWGRGWAWMDLKDTAPMG